MMVKKARILRRILKRWRIRRRGSQNFTEIAAGGALDGDHLLS